MTPRRCAALLSGGLDSMLAIRLMQQQGVEVEAVHLQTPFTHMRPQAEAAAAQLDVRLHVLETDDKYLRLLEQPRFGYGQGANPCVDCRIYLFSVARQFMEDAGAGFLVSGEVCGQRVSCQKRKHLTAITHHAGVKDLLLRPLSAKLLPPTLPEREGWVDRQKLFDFTGNDRKGQLKLAAELGIEPPSPLRSCCTLMQPAVAPRVFDLIESPGIASHWDYQLLNTGRHFRFSPQQKVVLARNHEDSDTMNAMFHLPGASAAALLQPGNFRGPTALLAGMHCEAAIDFACGLILRFARDPGDAPRVNILTAAGSISRAAFADPAAENAVACTSK